MKKLRIGIAMLALVIGVGVLTPVATTNAASVLSETCKGVTDSTICKDQNADGNSFVKTVVSVLLLIVGALSVVMIIVGGLMYTASAGDSTNITRAKNTITYAVVGLVLSAAAYAIVQFVLDKLK